MIAAYVGNVFNGDIIGYRPRSPHVHRLDTMMAKPMLLEKIRRDRPLSAQCVLLRDPPEDVSPAAAWLARGGETRLFKSHLIHGGSIGVGFSQLWVGAVGAMILEPCAETPWDLCPVLGISRKLGFRFYHLEASLADGVLRETSPVPRPVVQTINHTRLVAHPANADEINAWLRRHAGAPWRDRSRR